MSRILASRRARVPRGSRAQASPILLVLIGGASVQLGAGVAKNLFDEVSPLTLVWLRLLTSAVVLMAAVRPRVRGRDRRDWLVVAGFGLALAVMNASIYESFARIPLGLAVTIEFAGPLALAVAGSRRPRDLLWVALAGVGVALLGFDTDGLTAIGVGFALLAGAMWAGYILLSGATGRRWPGLDGLALASVVATLAVTPLMLLDRPGDLTVSGGGPGGWSGGPDWRVLALGALVGLLSSVVPYSCELVALRTLAPATFGVLMSLDPAAAALAGMLVVGEVLSAPQWVAVVCVVAASIGFTRSQRTGAPGLAGAADEGSPTAAGVAVVP